jgi:hypothetical protein
LKYFHLLDEEINLLPDHARPKIAAFKNRSSQSKILISGFEHFLQAVGVSNK